MFGKKRDDNGEKLYRYSIRKYHFGAASVAIAALIFFANGVAKADMAVSPATANTEKVGVAVTGLTEGVPPTEGHSEKSQEVGSEKEAITKKSVDKSALNQALSDLQAEIAKIDNGKLSSLASQISQLTDESKRLLGDENTSEEAVATLVGRVQAMTEQVRQLQSKENGKEVEDNSLNSKQDSISDKDNEKNTPAVKDKIVEDKRTAVLNKKSTELSAGTESKTITVSEESYIVKEGKVKKELPTYTNEGDGVYKLKDELEFIYKTLEKAGADQSKIQATKEAYDKFNEVFSRGETISQEDFEAAVLNLKKSRDIIESVLKDKSSQASVDEMINSQPRSSDEELPSRNRGRTRTTRTVREGNVNYTNSIESFFEDGKKGDSPYDKYTYIFYSRRQVNAIDNADRRVDEARNQIYADVTPTDSGFKWDIYINRSRYDLSDSVAWFTIPNGQNLKRGSVDISWKSATGGYATSPNDGTIAGALRAAGFKNVTEGTPQDSGVDKSGNSTVNKKYYSGDLRALSHRGGITGQDPYKKHLETPEETRLAEEKFGIIEKSRGKLFYFEPNQDLKTYHLSFETTGSNNINTLAYAVGMKGERTDDDRPSYKSRFLVNQWYARTPGEKDATDSFKFKIVGNGYFKIDLNTVNALFAPGHNTYTQTKNGITYINHRDYMNDPLARDSKGNPQVNGVLTYNDVEAMTDYNGIDMTSYGVYYDEAGRLIPNEAPNGQGAKAQAGAKGQQFTLFKEANGTFRTLTREELTFDAIGTPGVHTYFYNRSFNDGSHDRGKFSFVTKPKKPTLTTDLTRQAGKIINIKAGNGTNGFEMRLYKREANGSLTVVNGTNGQPLTATAGADGVATFNNVKIEEADYVVKTVVEGTWIDYDNTRHSTVESDASDRKTATDGVPPTVKLINRTDGNKEAELSDNENNLPMVTVYRGAVLELPLKYYDNATTGKVNISYVNNNGIPRGVWFNKDINANQNVNISETGKTEKAQGEYTVRGRVAADARLGTSVVTLKVSDDSNGNVENGNKKLVKFKVRVVDLEFENRGTEVNATTRADVLGLGENSVDPNNYLRTTDGENVHNDSYFPSGMKFRYLNGNNLSETVSFDKIGKHSVKARAYFPDDPRAKELPTNQNNLTGDTSPVAGRGYLERTIEFNVRPNAPTLTDAQFYGTAGRRPDVTVSGLPTDSQLQNGASVTVELYQGDRKVASKIVSERNGSTTFSARDFSADLTEGQQVHAVVKVVGNSNSYTVNSNNSNRATVTGRVALNNLAEGKKIVQVQDLNRNGVLSEAEKNAIKNAILEANKNGVLQGKSVNDINISATGLITAVVRDNKVAELQIDPKTGVVTRFAHIRDDYDISFPSGTNGKIRPTDPGFEWSSDHKSLIYKFDATAGDRNAIINTNDILKKLTATPKTNKVTGQPSLAVVHGTDKANGEGNRDNYRRDGSTGYFYHNNSSVNMLDIVDPSNYGGNVQVANTANKLVAVNRKDINNGNIVGTTLGSDTISAANGAQAITFNNVVKKADGTSLIIKQQLYLMPKYTNDQLLQDRGNTKENNTNVINVYFVPVDPTKPDVTRSTTNNLSTTSDQANRLAENTSFKNLAKVTDNYDKDDATNATSNTVRSKLNMWLKNGSTKKLIVENGVEKADVIASLKKEVNPATYEVFAKTTDASGNKSHEDTSDGASLGFFRVGYNLVARQTINVVRGESISAGDLKTFIQVREGNTLQDLPQGATVTAALETNSIRNGKEETKTVEATVNFGENRTQKVTLTYKVLNTFPIARTLYDFKNPDTARSGGSSVYYHNGGTIPDGMTWIYKGSDNVEKRGDDFSTALSKDSVGSTSYTFGGKYNYGRFTNSPTTGNLEYTERVVHKVFDITDSNGVTVDKGAALTVNQAEAAVKKVDGSDPLPEGTTYEWVGSTDTNTPGVRTYKVRVTLPASQSGTEAQPAATQAKSSKTINVTVRVKPEQPEVNSTTTDNRILSTDKVLTGRGIAGATVKVTVNNKVLKEVRVQQNSEWSVSLDKGLNSNNVSNLGQIVERDIVKVTQSVDGVESAEKMLR
jgi:extracellular matrix-binding protein ebh